MHRFVGPILMLLVVALGVRIEGLRSPAVFTDSGILFIDPDDYMRLHRAREILEGRKRRIDFMPEINHPLGGRLHWTAPMDYLLVAAARVAGPLFGGDPQSSLDRTAAWLPVALGAIYLALVMRLLTRAGGWPPAVLVGLLLAVSPAFHRAFALGHPDHHCLLEFLFALAVLLWLPMPGSDGRRGLPSFAAVMCSGLCTGLAIWIAPQAMAVWLAILVGATYATYHAGRDERSGWALRRFEWNCGVFFMVLIGYLVENWPALVTSTVDRISAFHVALALLALMLPSGATYGSMPRASKRWLPAIRSWLWFATGMLVLGVWLAFEYDEVFGPVAQPEFFRWSEHIVELQPLWTRAGDQLSLAPMHDWLGWMPYGLLLALPFFLRGRQMSCGVKLTVALLAIGFTALAIAQRRWLDHAGLGLSIVLVYGLWALLCRIRSANSTEGGAAGWFACAAICAVLAYPGFHTVREITRQGPHPLDLRTAIVAGRILEYEQGRGHAPDAPRAILCDDAEGSMLLYRTRLPIVAAPYHRTIEGIVEAARYYAERNEVIAREQLEQLSASYVVVPFRAHEQLMNFERIAFGELRSYDPPVESIDARGLLHLELRYRPEIVQTMVYRLAMEPNKPPKGLECIAMIREGAQTPDGYSGLVYKVVPPPRPESEY